MIKKITKKNINDLLLLEVDNFNVNEQYKNIENLLKDKNYLLYGYFLSKKLVSYVICSVSFNECEILKICTDKFFRNKNYATELIENLKNKKFYKFFLEVSEKNSSAIALYKNLGFKIINVRKNYYSNNDDALIMELNLR